MVEENDSTISKYNQYQQYDIAGKCIQLSFKSQ